MAFWCDSTIRNSISPHSHKQIHTIHTHNTCIHLYSIISWKWCRINSTTTSSILENNFKTWLYERLCHLFIQLLRKIWIAKNETLLQEHKVGDETMPFFSGQGRQGPPVPPKKPGYGSEDQKNYIVSTSSVFIQHICLIFWCPCFEMFYHWRSSPPNVDFVRHWLSSIDAAIWPVFWNWIAGSSLESIMT